MLRIYAGKTALNKIQNQGFHQGMFSSFLGASGGPKWFTTFGLDKFLFGEFFKERNDELNIVGSSAGAFRAACFAQKDPVAAIERLAYKYARVVYSKKPTAAEISYKAEEILDYVFATTGQSEIINNPIFKAHFLVAKCNGLTANEHKLTQGAGLVASMLLNKINRRLLTKQYQRYIYQSPASTLAITDSYQFKTHHKSLTATNIKPALMASGSIPLVMTGIKDIAGSPKGVYRDGGIIDYHFDFQLKDKNNGLTLYPHFNPKPRAGWFDKNSNRKVLMDSYDNTVLIVPSAQFISALPYGKIPDRTDLTNLDATTRLKYWLKVLAETDRLAELFNEFLFKQDLSQVKPFLP